jgi:hypothetical protein
MAKDQQKKDEHRTQIKVAMIAAAGVIVAGVIGAIGSVVSNKSNGEGREEAAITSPSATRQQSASASSTPPATEYVPTSVYVTSVSTTDGGLSARSVTWTFTGTVRPPPGGRGAVFVLGKTIDGSKSVNSDAASIASDGSWEVVIGPIPRDFAWRMKWIAAYGEMLVNDADPRPNGQDPRDSAPSEPGPRDPGDQTNERGGQAGAAPNEPRLRDPGAPGDQGDSGSGGSIEPEAVTEIPKEMLPPQSP